MKKIFKNNTFIITFAIIAALLLTGDFVIQKYWTKETVIVTDPFDLVDVGTSTEIMSEDEIKQYNQKLDDGVVLFREGDNGDTEAYEKAIINYKEAAALSKYNSRLPYFHLGNIYRRLHQYDKADQAFSNALKISSNSEVSVYLSRIEMYRYELKKSNNDIKQVFAQALQFSNDINNVEVAYAGFLKDIGDKNEAITYYKKLLEKYPGNQTYQQEIEMLSK